MARKKPAEEAKKAEKQLTGLAARFAKYGTPTQNLPSVVGVRTRFIQVDHATRVGGWPLCRCGVIHGPSNEGKLVAIDEPVLTPGGWRPIGALMVGDIVTGGDGLPCRVRGIFPQGRKQLFRVRFSDGTSVESGAEHLWATRTLVEKSGSASRRGPRPARARIHTGESAPYLPRSTEEIARDLGARHEIPFVGKVVFANADPMPIDPYLLGLLLGDGSFAGSCIVFSKPESDLKAAVRSLLPGTDQLVPIDAVDARITGGSTMSAIRALGLAGLHSPDKFVPDSYAQASPGQRLALLRGLLDTDGSVTKDGCMIEFSSSSPRLFGAVVDLARGLGAYVTTTARPKPTYVYRGEKRIGKPSWRARISFNDGTVPISSAKHLAKWKGRSKNRLRRIVAIEPTREAEAVCIAVDSPGNLYVLRDYIVTHNTLFSIGLLGDFIAAGGLGHLVDAEHTTTHDWCRKLLGDVLVDSGRFIPRRPSTYEKCVNETRDIHKATRASREAGELPPHASCLTLVDSLRKLNPEDMISKIKRFGAEGDKGSVDGMGGRAAQIKAAMNAAWLDELVPLVDECKTAWVCIARETEDTNADVWSKKAGTDYKVQGGRAVNYDAALRCRIERDAWIKDAEERVVGERHRVTILKTKVGGKEDKYAVAFFHTSNGVAHPYGFDPSRDVVELAQKFGIVEVDGGGGARWKGQRWASREKLVGVLRDAPGELETLEAEVRAAFDDNAPEEFSFDPSATAASPPA